jgi:hypothetical protein
MTKGHKEIVIDRVIPLPSRLERAAVNIKKTLSKRNGPIQDWIDANIELAEALIEVRHEFGDNDAAFGAWWRYNGLTKDVLGKSERVAFIDMGANPQRMREVLQKTEQRSIPLIYKHEWAFPKAGKVLAILKEHAKRISRKSPRKQSGGLGREPEAAARSKTGGPRTASCHLQVCPALEHVDCVLVDGRITHRLLFGLPPVCHLVDLKVAAAVVATPILLS